MKTWHFYQPETGQFIGQTFTGREEFLADNVPSGCESIEGEHDPHSQRVDVEHLEADRAIARDKHQAEVEAARAAFEAGTDAFGRAQVLVEPAFEFGAGAEHVIDWQPPQPDADHEWNADSRRWEKTAAAAERDRKRLVALARIDTIERQQLRTMREHALGYDGAAARLKAMDEEILALRADL